MHIIKKVTLKLKYLINKKLGYLLYKLIYITPNLMNNHNIWLLGSSSGSSYKDNSASFHQYLVNKRKDIQVYWVINRYSEDLIFFKDNPSFKFVYRNSIKANVFALLSKVHIVTHGPKDVTPYNYKKHKKTLKINFGHGIQGLKKIKANKEKLSSINKHFDMFIASSSMDKSIKASWGINKRKIIITGLPRYDDLIKKYNVQGKRKNNEILYMPTWREWLLDTNILNTDYYKNIKSLLTDEYLKKILKQNNIQFKVYLHINMKDFFKNFECFQTKNVKILPYNDNVQDHIVNSDLLITDYSSVCWDFIYLDKPVLFYRFDIEEYNEKRGSYIDLYDNKFGPNLYNKLDLLESLETLINERKVYQIKEEDKNEVFQYMDSNNCDRVLEKIEEIL